MCGITGFLQPIGFKEDIAKVTAKRMADALISRGPDDSEIWVDKKSGIVLAHRRLSIIDLSTAGQQPMSCPEGRYTIAFNGEIYNHLNMRAELDKTSKIIWRGHSDTETLMACISVWGIENTITRCIGMFAFALWDKKKSTLTLGRDRMGEKPLYYGWQGKGENSVFLFGSELKAIKKHHLFIKNIDRNALCLFMRHNYIPAPHSIYCDIYKLLPGHLLSISTKQHEPIIKKYWSLKDVAISGVESPIKGSPQDIIFELENLLKSSVRQQMMADVPLGAFLSGGIDSSTIVALMQAQSNNPIKTFTIGFNDKNYNEALYAKEIASYLGTDHTELYVTPQQAMEVIPKLPELYCEPFADSSQIPTFLVCQLAKQKVKVSLSGDAGDELFAGYNRYILTQKLWGKLSLLPVKLRTVAASCIKKLSPAAWDKLISQLQLLTPKSFHQFNGHKLHKGAGVLDALNIDDLYFKLISHCEPKNLVIDGIEPTTFFREESLQLGKLDDIQRMMAIDAISYLPDDILVKTDRASMGTSLEGRMPFLDHRIVEFAWRIPNSMKLHEKVGKWILRQVLYKYLPKKLVERPKMGFGFPIGDWLRGPLRDWAEELLDESRLQQETYINHVIVRKIWLEHLSGKRNWECFLWNILMFQTWLEAEIR